MSDINTNMNEQDIAKLFAECLKEKNKANPTIPDLLYWADANIVPNVDDKVLQKVWDILPNYLQG